MRYNDDAQLDTSEVSDMRGGGGGGGLLGGMLGGRAAAGGGIGIIGVVAYLLFSLLGGGSGGGGGFGAADVVLGGLGQGQQTADNTEVARNCRTGADANKRLECAVVADIDSIQAYWTRELPSLGRQYTKIDTVWFTGSVRTGCGSADSGAGPFYCPADKLVYIDLSFYDDIRTEFKAEGGLFVDAYVLAHEYGHHVQDLLGVESKVRTRQGANSDSVRLELQADCYAGVWAKHATEPGPNGEQPLISDITDQDIQNALQVAGRIGDDWIQKNLGNGHVDQNSFTHGSSAQRQRWFTTGYSSGEPARCDTFGTNSL